MQAFLKGVVKFPQITELCERAVSEHPFIGDPTLEDILRLDAWAKRKSKRGCVDVAKCCHVTSCDYWNVDSTTSQLAGNLQVTVGLGFVILFMNWDTFLSQKPVVSNAKFYIGFDINGWNLGKFTWSETEYGIGILPLGGYVKMLGQDDNPAAAAREAQRAKDIVESGDLPPEPTSDPPSVGC